jgi:hypothetical protein
MFSLCKMLIRTERNYIGAAPDQIQAGDLICVVLGCNIPLAIRRVEDSIRRAEDHYVIVGGCYIYGMMDGEVMKWVRYGELCLENLNSNDVNSLMTLNRDYLGIRPFSSAKKLALEMMFAQ